MIIDKLANWQTYESWLPGVAKAMQIAHSEQLQALELGSTELDGEALMVNKMQLTTRPSTALAENHQRYIDVHCPITAAEQIEVRLTRPDNPVKLYQPDDDAELFDCQGSTITIAPGECAIIFPGEVHKAAVSEQPYALEKAVFKVRQAT